MLPGLTVFMHMVIKSFSTCVGVRSVATCSARRSCAEQWSKLAYNTTQTYMYVFLSYYLYFYFNSASPCLLLHVRILHVADTAAHHVSPTHSTAENRQKRRKLLAQHRLAWRGASVNLFVYIFSVSVTCSTHPPLFMTDR